MFYIIPTRGFIDRCSINYMVQINTHACTYTPTRKASLLDDAV